MKTIFNLCGVTGAKEEKPSYNHCNNLTNYLIFI